MTVKSPTPHLLHNIRHDGPRPGQPQCGTVNMYNNSVALTNTRFDMDADPGAADRMAAEAGEE